MTDVHAIFVENRSADRFQLSHEADVEDKRSASAYLTIFANAYQFLFACVYESTFKFAFFYR